MAGVLSELAHVALLRSRPAGLEFLVVSRGAGWSLPAGAIHGNEDVRVAAARVLFEDTGVLLGRDVGDAAATLEMPSLPALRRKILAGANATQVLFEAGFTWAQDAVLAWSHWQAPSSSGLSSPGIRLDGMKATGTTTRVFIAALPTGFAPHWDAKEGVQHEWVLASEVGHRDDLALAPHVIRTAWELAHFDKLAEVVAAARKRAQEPHPILPRVGPNLALLLPWDPDYASLGQGEALEMSYLPKWALGPSRFVRKDRTWQLTGKPKG
ncbi:MAG: NUDIX domain-containing protein [Kofleriaceae bacterium]